jgi:hypothetical protein
LTVDDAEQQSSCAMELTITPPLPPPAASTASGRVTHARLQSRTSRPPRLIDPLLGDAGVASFALVSSLAIPNGSHATAIVLRVAPDEHATDFAHVVVTESDPCGAWVAPAQMDTSIAVIREVLGAPPPARITVELRDAANRRLERSELRLSHECVALFSYPGSRLSLEAVRTVCDEPRTYPAPR